MTYITLSDALYECFKGLIGTNDESQLHEDGFVKKKFKEFVGAKEFKKFDSLDDKVWNEAWREFDIRVLNR